MPEDSTLSEGQKADCESALRLLITRVDLSQASDIITRTRAKIMSVRLVEQRTEVLAALDIAQGLTRFIERYEGGTKAHPRRIALAALEYFADPWEVIPDFIPRYGLLDDAYVLHLARTMIGPDAIAGPHEGAAGALLHGLPPNAGQHLAHRAMERGVLDPADRAFLSNIGNKLTGGERVREQDAQRFADLVRILVELGVAQQPCRPGCATCRALSTLTE